MAESDEKIEQLQARLDKMDEYQDFFYREINLIKNELKKLQIAQTQTKTSSQAKPSIETPREPQFESTVKLPNEPQIPVYQPPRKSYTPPKTSDSENNRSKYTTPHITSSVVNGLNLEEFVGRNLISLIGIIITIIGVGIGAKYAIDRNLISPTTRILLGYLFAGGLFATAVWLKKKYLNFSAVLMSGALAMMYFLTFFAYSYYALFPQRLAFAMMLFFTAFTVAAAINYNRQVIAHIGLVGAYAVPFLLSNDSGRADILFGYMTIINFGILAISLKKFWKPLYYSSFIFTWLIYSAWFLTSFRTSEHFTIAFGFAFVFFLTFYLTFLSYKLIAKEEFNQEIIVLTLVNSFIFYGFGYAILKSRDAFEPYLGMFTLANALLNFLVAFVIHKYQLGDRRNYYLAIALAVTFSTIAVPVQFEGNWVTLIWTAEAALLFCIGRMKQIALYEKLSYPLMFLASISLMNDWQTAFLREIVLTPIFNSDFMTTMIFAAAFGFITFVNRDERYKSSIKDKDYLPDIIFPTIFLLVLYNAFRTEISVYFHAQTIKTAVDSFTQSNFSDAIYRKDGDLTLFNIVWQINYTMFFLSVLSFVNIKRIKNATLGYVNLSLNILILLIFLIVGLYLIAELRTSFLMQTDAAIFPRGAIHILIRYISLAFAAALIYAGYEYTRQEFTTKKIRRAELDLAFELIFHVALLWTASSELLNLMDIFGFGDSDKLGLSILWGIYALGLIVLGIIKKKAHLRIGAIVLFAGTLVKLFFYDIAELNTISKTVVFVVLGVLLLIISFLYNKYKDLIFEVNKS